MSAAAITLEEDCFVEHDWKSKTLAKTEDAS